MKMGIVVVVYCLTVVVPDFYGAKLSAQEVDVAKMLIDTQKMMAYLAREAERLDQEAFQRVSTREKLKSEKGKLRQEFRFMIGLDPLPERTPLQVTLVRTIQRDEYVVDVLHFQSMPKLFVTANVYRPIKRGSGPFPAVILGPGHLSHPHGGKAARQNYAIPWVRAGYIAMVIDPIQVAELFAVHRGTASFQMWDWYARGYTPIGVEVWNAMRAVDYLLTRSDVDGAKLTINGCSGGGHLSWMLAAADERIAVAQPVAGAADIKSHIIDNLQRMHCDCAFFINTYRHDWPTLAALIAPRPLLIHGSTEDVYYPPKSYNAVFQRAQTIYRNHHASDRVGIFEVTGQHAYTKVQRERAVLWSNRWLLGDTTPVVEHPFDEISGERLAAFGASVPENINDRIHELFIPTPTLPSHASLTEWKESRKEILEKLQTVVFRNLPRPYVAHHTPENHSSEFSLETEPGIQIGITSHPAPKGSEKRAMLYIASPGDTRRGISALLRSYPWKSRAASMHIVWPRGVGIKIWDDQTEWKIRRSAMLLGRTLDDMRLFDVLCAIDHVINQPGFDDGELTVIGEGCAGMLGAYAALLDSRVTRVVLRSPPLSHKTGPIFLNILRYCDVPQALAMLAPRELVFLSDDMDQFAFVSQIYKLYGMQGNFLRAQTITQILHHSY